MHCSVEYLRTRYDFKFSVTFAKKMPFTEKLQKALVWYVLMDFVGVLFSDVSICFCGRRI